MSKRVNDQTGQVQVRQVLFIAGWAILILAGVGLVWFGFFRPDRDPAAPEPTATSPAAEPTVAATATLAPSPTPAPTFTPLATVAPTPVPATATPTASPATLTAGPDGVNLRGGPGTDYTRLGYLEPQTQAPITGRYEDWWQIQYEGSPAWVYGELVTPENADGVPQVEPPAAPTSPPVPTSPPATAAPPTEPPAEEPPAQGSSGDMRGIVVNEYIVEGAPGPYPAGGEIWFSFNITNNSGNLIDYNALGTWVEETGQYQKSWSYSSMTPGQNITWRDKLTIPAPGTYHLWLAIQFSDGSSTLLRGPVQVTVQ
jgi:uncharacterized protein YraI